MIGPRTSEKEFFEEHLDTAIPALASIPQLVKNDDMAGARKVFADYVRSFLQPEKLIRFWFRKHDDKHIAHITERAKDIMDYKFRSCGIPWQFTDKKVDWHFNPTYNAYREWPWQLSRHPELSVLAEYYCYTHDENAAKTYVDMINSWFEQAIVPVDEPAHATVCWRTIEAGIRMTGWSYQIHAFLHSSAVTDEFLTRYFISIFEHGRRLRNDCTHGNWLLMEMHGLIRISVLYPFLKYSKEWYEFSVKRLEEELVVQVYPDGFQYELSTNYHGVVDGNYSGIYNIFRDMEIEAPYFLEHNLENLYEMYPHLCRPDRRLPDINDGNEMKIQERMARAYSLYPNREDFLWFATDGKEGTMPDYLSYAFPYAGAVAMRTSWDENAVWGYMDCSPFGRGHQHEDKLNVLVFAYGKKLITEGGIYDYDTSEMRKYVLSTRAHNTIRINGMDQNQRSIYKWNTDDINKKADFEFSTTPALDTAESEYTYGYGENHDAVIHKRKLMFFKDIEGTQPFFVVIDTLKAPDNEKRTYEAMWHFEGCEFTEDGLYVNGDFGDGVGLTAVFSDTDAKVVNMQGQYEPYYQGFMPIRPSGPHEHRPVPTPVLCGEFEGEKRIVTVLYPYSDGKNIVKSVKASSDVNSNDITIVLSDGREISLLS